MGFEIETSVFNIGNFQAEAPWKFELMYVLFCRDICFGTHVLGKSGLLFPKMFSVQPVRKAPKHRHARWEEQSAVREALEWWSDNSMPCFGMLFRHYQFPENPECNRFSSCCRGERKSQ